jgi:hypothetical protein
MEYKFEDLGEHRVKNIARPVRVFRVSFDPEGTTELTPSEATALEAEASGAGGKDSNAAEPVELAFWQSVEASDNPKEYRAYLTQFPQGAFVALANARLAGSGGTSSSNDHTIELEFWNSIKDTDVRANFQAYIDKYPDGEFRSLAEIRLADLPETIGSDPK